MTTYRYYPDMDALISDVRQVVRRDFARHLADVGAVAQDVDERFRRMCRACLGFAIEREAEYRLLFEEKTARIGSASSSADVTAAWLLLPGMVRRLAPALGGGRGRGQCPPDLVQPARPFEAPPFRHADLQRLRTRGAGVDRHVAHLRRAL